MVPAKGFQVIAVVISFLFCIDCLDDHHTRKKESSALETGVQSSYVDVKIPTHPGQCMIGDNVDSYETSVTVSITCFNEPKNVWPKTGYAEYEVDRDALNEFFDVGGTWKDITSNNWIASDRRFVKSRLGDRLGPGMDLRERVKTAKNGWTLNDVKAVLEDEKYIAGRYLTDIFPKAALESIGSMNGAPLARRKE